MDMPPPVEPPAITQPAPQDIKRQCVIKAAEAFRIEPNIIHAVARTEGGEIGSVVENTNGTWDLGVMQINTVNLDLIRDYWPSVDAEDLVFSPCASILVGAWFLDRQMASSESVIEAIGNYHSRTPHVHDRYLELFRGHYRQVSDEFGTGADQFDLPQNLSHSD